MRFKIRILIAVLAGLACSAPAWAVVGEIKDYFVTLKSIQLKNQAGDWVTIDNKEREIDMSKTDEPLIYFINKGKVPPGLYTNFKITIGETVRFSGELNGNKTKEGGKVVFAAAASKLSDVGFPGEFLGFEEVAPSWTKDGPEGIVSVHFDLDYRDRDDIIEIYSRLGLKRSLIIKDNSYFDLFVVFQRAGEVKFAWPNSFAPGVPKKEAMYMEPPEMSEVTVRVDGSVSLTTAEQIEIAY